ncbi:MAG TPA: hypothetical protein VF681_01715 [Abditibacteriaceae bacterium]|jgi:hypothetical protein
MTQTSETSAIPVARPKVSAGSIIAAGTLLLLALLAFDPLRVGDTASPADKITLLFLAICAAVCGWTPLRRHFQNADAATFTLAAAWFIIYAVARRGGPSEGWALHFVALPDSSFPISYAARIAVIGALTAAAMNRRTLSSFTRAALGAFLVLGIFVLGTFLFLARFYQIGEVDAPLNPVPLVHTLLQLIEYGAVATLCGVAAGDARVRDGLLKVLPALLLALWARHYFAAPVEEADEE